MCDTCNCYCCFFLNILYVPAQSVLYHDSPMLACHFCLFVKMFNDKVQHYHIFLKSFKDICIRMYVTMWIQIFLRLDYLIVESKFESGVI